MTEDEPKIVSLVEDDHKLKTGPKQKSRKSRQLEIAANKPGQKSMRDFFNSSSVKDEPENGVGLTNVAKSEPPMRRQKRKLSSCEIEDISVQKSKQNITPEIEIDDVESEYFPSGDSQNLFDDSQIETQPISSKLTKTVKPKRKKINESMNSQRRRTNERNRKLQGLYKDFKGFTNKELIGKDTIARFYDANEGRLDCTIVQLHNHIKLALAAKECFHSDFKTII